MMTTRDEHLAFCKKRALAYVERGNIKDAIASMLSDLKKHDETKDHPGAMLFVANYRSLEDARNWIEGFR